MPVTTTVPVTTTTVASTTTIAQPVTTTTAPSSGTLPALSVSGSQILAGGQPIVLRGVNRSGTEYACSQGWGIFDGPSDQSSITAIKSWDVDVVRIPLNEDCWLDINGVNSAYAGQKYISAVEGYVSLLNQNGLYAILDLQWTAPGTTLASGQEPMPDQDHSPAFWTSVASTFAANHDVMFDLFNEPYPDDNSDTTAAWQCWQQGGSCPGDDIGYTAAGSQQLVNDVRATGASNVVLVGGIGYAGTLDQWVTYAPSDPDRQVVADMHNYNFGRCTTESCWASTLSDVGDHPLLTDEIGETDGTGSYIDSYMAWADQNKVGYLAWTWDTWGCGDAAVVISNYDGTACSGYGQAYESHVQAVGP